MADSTVEDGVSSSSMTKRDYRWYYDVAVICVMIAIVWGLMSLPTIVYFLPQVHPHTYNIPPCMRTYTSYIVVPPGFSWGWLASLKTLSDSVFICSYR